LKNLFPKLRVRRESLAFSSGRSDIVTSHERCSSCTANNPPEQLFIPPDGITVPIHARRSLALSHQVSFTISGPAAFDVSTRSN
jgi:hypothetical protein